MKKFKFKYITFYFIVAVTFIFNAAYTHAHSKVSPEDRNILKWCHKLSNQQICDLNNLTNDAECLKNCYMGKRQAHNHIYIEMCRKAYMTYKN